MTDSIEEIAFSRMLKMFGERVDDKTGKIIEGGGGGDKPTLLQYLRTKSTTGLTVAYRDKSRIDISGGVEEKDIDPILNGSVHDGGTEGIYLGLSDATVDKLAKNIGNKKEKEKIVKFINKRIEIVANNAVHVNLPEAVEGALAVHETDVHGDKCAVQVTAKKAGLVEWYKPTPLYYDMVSGVFYSQREFEESIDTLVPQGTTFESFKARFTIIEDFKIPDELPDTSMIDTGDLTDRGSESLEVLIFMKRLEELCETKIMKAIEELKNSTQPDKNEKIAKLEKKLKNYLRTTRGNHGDLGIASQNGGEDYLIHYKETLKRLQEGRDSLFETVEFELEGGKCLKLHGSHSYVDMFGVTLMLVMAIFEPEHSTRILELCASDGIRPNYEECKRLHEVFKTFMEHARSDKENKYGQLVSLYDKVINNIKAYSQGVEDDDVKIAVSGGRIVEPVELSKANGVDNDKIMTFLSRCLGLIDCSVDADIHLRDYLSNSFPTSVFTAQESIGLYGAVCKAVGLAENWSNPEIYPTKLSFFPTWQRENGHEGSTAILGVDITQIPGFVNEGNAMLIGHTQLQNSSNPHQATTRDKLNTGIIYGDRGVSMFFGENGNTTTAAPQVIAYNKGEKKYELVVDSAFRCKRGFRGADSGDSGGTMFIRGKGSVEDVHKIVSTQQINVKELYDEYTTEITVDESKEEAEKDKERKRLEQRKKDIHSMISPPLTQNNKVEIVEEPVLDLSSFVQSKDKAIAVPEGAPIVRRKQLSLTVRTELTKLYNSIVDGKEENEMFARYIVFDNMAYYEELNFPNISIETINKIFDDGEINKIADNNVKEELREKYRNIRFRIVQDCLRDNKLSNVLFSKKIESKSSFDDVIRVIDNFVNSSKMEIKSRNIGDYDNFVLNMVKTYFTGNDFNELPELLIRYLAEKNNEKILEDVIAFAKRNGAMGKLGGLLDNNRDRFGSRRVSEMKFIDQARKTLQQKFLLEVNRGREKALNVSEVIEEARGSESDAPSISDVEDALKFKTAKTMGNFSTTFRNVGAVVTGRKYAVKGDRIEATKIVEIARDEVVGETTLTKNIKKIVPIESLSEKRPEFIKSLKSHCRANGVTIKDDEALKRVTTIIEEVEKEVKKLEKEIIENAIKKEEEIKKRALTLYEKTKVTNANKIRMQEQVDMVSKKIAEYPVELLDTFRSKTLRENFLGLTDIERKFAGKSGNDFYTANPTILKSRFQKWKEKAERLEQATWRQIENGELVDRANKYKDKEVIEEANKLTEEQKLAYIQRKIQRHQRRYYLKTVTSTGDAGGSDTPIRTHQEVAVLTLLGKHGAKEEMVEISIEEVKKGVYTGVKVKRETIISEAVEDGNGVTVKSYWDAINKELEEKIKEEIKVKKRIAEMQEALIKVVADADTETDKGIKKRLNKQIQEITKRITDIQPILQAIERDKQVIEEVTKKRIKEELTDHEDFRDSYVAIATDRLISGFSDIRGDNVVVDKYTGKLRVVDAYSPEYTMFETIEDSFGGRVFNLGKLTNADVEDKDIFDKVNLMYLDLEFNTEIEKLRREVMEELRDNMPKDPEISLYAKNKKMPVGGVDLLFNIGIDTDGAKNKEDYTSVDEFLLSIIGKGLGPITSNKGKRYEDLMLGLTDYDLDSVDEGSVVNDIKKLRGKSYHNFCEEMWALAKDKKPFANFLQGCVEDAKLPDDVGFDFFLDENGANFYKIMYLKLNYPKLLNYYSKRLKFLKDRQLFKGKTDEIEKIRKQVCDVNGRIIVRNVIDMATARVVAFLKDNPDRQCFKSNLIVNEKKEIVKLLTSNGSIPLASPSELNLSTIIDEHKAINPQSFPVFFLKLSELMEYSKTRGSESYAFKDNAFGDVLKIYIDEMENATNLEDKKAIQTKMTKKIINSMNSSIFTHLNMIHKLLLNKKYDELSTTEKETLKISLFSLQNTRKLVKIIINGIAKKRIVNDEPNDIKLINDNLTEMSDSVDEFLNIETDGVKLLDVPAVLDKGKEAIINEGNLKIALGVGTKDEIATKNSILGTIDKIKNSLRTKIEKAEATEILEKNGEIVNAQAKIDERAKTIADKRNPATAATEDDRQKALQEIILEEEKKKKEEGRATEIIVNASRILSDNNGDIIEDEETDMKTRKQRLSETASAVTELDTAIKNTPVKPTADSPIKASNELRDSIVKSRKAIKKAIGIDNIKQKMIEQVDTLIEIEKTLATVVQDKTQTSFFSKTLSEMSEKLQGSATAGDPAGKPKKGITTLVIGDSKLHFHKKEPMAGGGIQKIPISIVEAIDEMTKSGDGDILDKILDIFYENNKNKKKFMGALLQKGFGKRGDNLHEKTNEGEPEYKEKRKKYCIAKMKEIISNIIGISKKELTSLKIISNFEVENDKIVYVGKNKRIEQEGHAV